MADPGLKKGDFKYSKEPLTIVLAHVHNEIVHAQYLCGSAVESASHLQARFVHQKTMSALEKSGFNRNQPLPLLITVAEKGHLLLLPFGDSAMERCNGSSQWKRTMEVRIY